MDAAPKYANRRIIKWISSVPSLGDFVLSGFSKEKLTTAELLKTVDMDSGGSVNVWIKIDPTNKFRVHPSAIFFNDSVFLISPNERSVGMLKILGGHPGQ